jgi:hypothetical protein
MTRTRTRYEIFPDLHFPELDSDLSKEELLPLSRGTLAKVGPIII